MNGIEPVIHETTRITPPALMAKAYGNAILPRSTGIRSVQLVLYAAYRYSLLFYQGTNHDTFYPSYMIYSITPL